MFNYAFYRRNLILLLLEMTRYEPELCKMDEDFGCRIFFFQDNEKHVSFMHDI